MGRLRVFSGYIRTGPVDAPERCDGGDGSAESAASTPRGAGGAESERQEERAGRCVNDTECVAQRPRGGATSKKNVGMDAAG